MVSGPSERIDGIFSSWVSKGVPVVQEPHDAVCGRKSWWRTPKATSSEFPHSTEQHARTLCTSSRKATTSRPQWRDGV